ncbi:hypothetical protein FOZ63_032309, partial [Perkinsus olseni]
IATVCRKLFDFVTMLYLYDRAELRRVTSGILHHLDSKMRGMPEDCLSEVWAMAHPQIEGLERASRISLFADDGSAFSALQGCLSDDAEYKWTRGRGGPGSKDKCTPFLQYHGVEFTTLTVSNDVGWLKTAWSPEATVWQMDLISEKVLAVFEEPVEPYDLRAQPDGPSGTMVCGQLWRLMAM